MTPIDVKSGDLETVLAILRQYAPGRDVRVFGSRATRTAKPFSDLDLVLMGDVPLSASAMADLREAFSESDLPFKVDIVEWAKTRESFRRVIGEGAVALVGGRIPRTPR